MTRRHGVAMLVASGLLLTGAVAAWWSTERSGADLVGAAVLDTSTTQPPDDDGPAAPPTTATPTSDPTIAPTPGRPERLSIPELRVDAPVVPVGLEADGSMEIPGAEQSGWYLHGALPGSDRGSAVIAAHVDHGGRRGVFFDLRELQVGAEVMVTDASGDRHSYRVTERFQVDKDALPIPELFRGEGEPMLTLITCGGAFDGSARSYRDNIVVRAAPVGP